MQHVYCHYSKMMCSYFSATFKLNHYKLCILFACSSFCLESWCWWGAVFCFVMVFLCSFLFHAVCLYVDKQYKYIVQFLHACVTSWIKCMYGTVPSNIRHVSDILSCVSTSVIFSPLVFSNTTQETERRLRTDAQEMCPNHVPSKKEISWRYYII